MLGEREATSEQSSSVYEGAGYDEVYLLRHRPEEGLSQSLERELSAHSPIDEEEDYDREGVEEREGDKDEYHKGERENKRECEGEDDKDEGEDDERAPKGGSLGSLGDGHTCPFILPAIWIVNDFKSTMTTNIFNNLWDRYQIPDNVPIRLSEKFEKCYSGKTADVGMYDAMFAAGLRLPLTALHHQLAIFLGLFVNQIASNAWSIFIGVEILWGHLSGGNCQLTLDEFF